METFSIMIKEQLYQFPCNLDEDADIIAEKILQPICPALYTPEYIGIRAVTVAQIQRAQLRLAKQRINDLLECQERTIQYFNDTSPPSSSVYSPQEVIINNDENNNSKTWRDVLSPQSLPLHATSMENSPTKQQVSESNNRNKCHVLLTFPLSEVVEHRIVSAMFVCYRENRDQLDISVPEDQITLEWFYTAITEVAQRTGNGGGSRTNREALDDYLQRILVPSADELGLLPFSIIALDNTLLQMGNKLSQFRDILSRYSQQIHEWFVAYASYELSLPSPSLKNSNKRVQQNGMLKSPPSSAKNEQRKKLFSSLSLDTNLINDKKDNNTCLYFAPIHSPTKLTTRTVFLHENTEELKERARWSTSHPSPSKDSQEMKKMGKELQRDDQRREKLTQQSVLPIHRSPTKGNNSPTIQHGLSVNSSVLHHYESKQKDKHNHNHMRDDIVKEMNLNGFLRFLKSHQAIPCLIHHEEAEKIFLEITSWNHHHPELIYSVLDPSLTSYASSAIVTDTISSVDDPDVALTLPERGFTLTLAVLATYCYSHISLGEERLEKLLKELSTGE